MRRQLLNVSLNTENNLEAVISDIEKKDLKFLERKLLKLENELEDAEEALEKRLATQEVIDESVVESLFGTMVELETRIQMYECFRDYYEETNN